MIDLASSTHYLHARLKGQSKFRFFALIFKFLILTLLLSFFFWRLPISAPVWKINLWSDTAGIAQLFLNNGNGNSYTEENSIRTEIRKGQNTLRYPLPIVNAPARWDPLEQSATVKIYDSYVTIFGIRILPNQVSLASLHGVKIKGTFPGEVTFYLEEGINDPQVSAIVATDAAERARLLLSVIAGLLVSLLVTMSLLFRQSLILTAEETAANILYRLKIVGLSAQEFATLCVIGAISNIYFLANFSFSIDDEFGAIRENAEVWIGQGRWAAYLVEQFLFSQPAIPFAPFIVLVLCLAISYALIVRAHAYSVNWKTYGCFPLFCAFPTWWFISEFYSNVPTVGIGLLLVSISLYLTYQNNSLGRLDARLSKGTILTVLILLACAVGAYQSLILLYLCMAFGAALARLLRSDGSSAGLTGQAVQKVLQASMLSIGGVLLYGVINFFAQWISGAHSAYIDGFVRIDRFLESPLRLISSVLFEQWQVYSGDAAIFGADLPLAPVLLTLATLAVVLASRKTAFLCFLLWLGILTIPFGIHFLSGANAMPMRSMVSLAYVTWLMGIILISINRPIVVLTAITVVAFYQLQIISVNSQYIASSTITQEHDRILAADIYRRIGELSENFDRSRPIAIDVYGHKSVKTVYASAWSSTMQASFFDWDQGNIGRMVFYMKVMGYQNIEIAGEVERRSLTPLFRTMPVWPAKGSVKKVGEIYLVKLGQNPDPFHAGSDFLE